MKKSYISPINKVHVLATHDGILESASQVGGGGTSTPGNSSNFDGGLGGESGETPTTVETEDGARTSGSSNIWDNQW